MSFPYQSNQDPYGFSYGSSQPPTVGLQGPGYPPHAGGGFPCPPTSGFPPQPSSSYPSAPAANPVSNYNAPNLSTTPYSGSAPYSAGAPYSQSSVPYPLNPSSGSPYPSNPSAGSPYPPNPSAGAPYPPNPSAGSPYPHNPNAAAPYPPNPSAGAPYAPTAGSAPFGSSGSAPYAPNPYASAAYPAPGSSFQQQSPYPPAGDYGYPPKTNVSAYPNLSSAPGHGSSPQTHGASGALWPYQERPTVRPAMSFDPSGDAAALRKAMKGFGTNEKAITQVLGRRTSQQRQQIILKYQQAYGKESEAGKEVTGDLIKDLKKELSGQFESAILALMTPMPNYLAQELNKAIMGLGTNEKALTEILCANDNNTLRTIKGAYQTLFKTPLEKDLKGDTSGPYRRLVVAMAAASRDETNTDTSIAPRLAQELYKAGEKKLGTDEAEFNRILALYSFPVLRCTFDQYRNIRGKTFEAAIKSETSGDHRDGLLALYSIINNRAAFFATELHNAMKGMGTKDEAVIRIVVSRSEVDMGNIKDEYTKLFGKRLEDVITSETSGDYKSLLLALIQG